MRPIPLRGLWWGSQAHYAEHLPKLIVSVEPFTTWVENPAGSNTNAFVMQQLGKDVITNDSSFYSYNISRSILGRQGYDRYDEDIKTVQPYEGYCTTSGKFDAFPKDVRMLIDGYARIDNPYIKTLLGKTLAVRTSYRSYDWDKKLMSKATVPVFQSWMLASHRLLSQYVGTQRSGKLLGSYNMDWKKFIKTVDVKDAVLYSDFSWPWDPKYGGGAGGPQLYKLFYDIDCILKQQDVDTSQLEVWTVDNVHEKLIEYLKLVADSGKFKAFFLSCQDKDYPPKRDIDWIIDMLGLKYDYHEFDVQVGFGSTRGKKSIMKEELWVIRFR
jgi:hypothetical protein